MDRKFELERIGRMADDLKNLIYGDVEEITEYVVKEGKNLSDAKSSVENWKRTRIDNPWNDIDPHRWFYTVLKMQSRGLGDVYKRQIRRCSFLSMENCVRRQMSITEK